MKDNRSIKSKEYSKKLTLICIGAAIACLLSALALSLTLLKLSGPGIQLPITPDDVPKTTSSPTEVNPGIITEDATKDPVNTPDYNISSIAFPESAICEGLLTLINKEQKGCPATIGDLVCLKEQSDCCIKVAAYKTYLTENAYKAVNSMQKEMNGLFTKGMVLTTMKTIDLSSDNTVTTDMFDEHCTGNSMNLKFMDEKGASYQLDDAKVSSEVSWMKENAWKYGLIFRYPNDKSAITKLSEPGHLRYVGVFSAKYMYENNLCLEEYISLVKDYSFNSPLIVELDSGLKCRIYYIKAEQDGDTEIYYRTRSDAETYGEITVSGNGSDGFIVCQEYSEK